MIRIKLLSLLTGYVSLMVQGESLEKFVNMAAGRGIFLWDIVRLNNHAIQAKVRISEVRPLRHIAKTTGSRFKIVERRGLPFFSHRLRQRKLLAIGAVVFLVTLYLLSSFVWFIDVTGTDKLSPQQIKGIASQAGLRPGMAKWNLDVKAVEKEIRDQLPSVAWAGITVEGTRVTIEIAERKLVTEDVNKGPAHIIAGKAGLIKEVLVLKGQAMVKEGDTVLPGQVLISGETQEEIKPEPSTQPLPEGQEPPEPKYMSHFVQAKGIVRARVWYEGYGECLLRETVEEFSGQEKTSVRIKFGSKEIIISGPKSSPYQHDETKQLVKRLPQWRNIQFPVELSTVRYREKIIHRLNHGSAGAKKIAEQRAMEELRAKLPEGAKITQQRLEEINTGRLEELVRIKVFVETVEDIGQTKPFKVNEEDMY